MSEPVTDIFSILILRPSLPVILKLQDDYRGGAFRLGVVLPDFKGREKMIGTCGFTELDPANNRGEIVVLIRGSGARICIGLQAGDSLRFEQLSLNP